jgi:hypothetical protein
MLNREVGREESAWVMNVSPQGLKAFWHSLDKRVSERASARKKFIECWTGFYARRYSTLQRRGQTCANIPALFFACSLPRSVSSCAPIRSSRTTATPNPYCVGYIYMFKHVFDIHLARHVLIKLFFGWWSESVWAPRGNAHASYSARHLQSSDLIKLSYTKTPARRKFLFWCAYTLPHNHRIISSTALFGLVILIFFGPTQTLIFSTEQINFEVACVFFIDKQPIHCVKKLYVSMVFVHVNAKYCSLEKSKWKLYEKHKS